MAKQAAKRSPKVHPLQQLVASLHGEKPSSLKHLAYATTEGGERDPSAFARQLQQKIENTKYRAPNSELDGPTFAKILQNAGVMQVLMSAPVMRQIALWIRLGSVLVEDQKARHERKSIERLPIKFHKKVVRELGRHFTAIASLENGNPELAEALDGYTDAVWREIKRHFLALYIRHDWRKLFNEDKLKFRPRDPEVSASVAIYKVLQRSLQNTKTRKMGISDQFLRALTGVIMGRAATGDALRQAINERR